jgi:hypothetical protein
MTPGKLLDKIEDESAVQCVARRVRPIDIAAFRKAEIHSQRDREEDKNIRPMVKDRGPPTFHIPAKQPAAESQTHTLPFSTNLATKLTAGSEHLRARCAKIERARKIGTLVRWNGNWLNARALPS